MKQLTFTYYLADDNGISNSENVPILVAVGGIFMHEFGTYKVMEHHKEDDGEIIPYCERISKIHL